MARCCAWVSGAVILTIAGLYQFSSLKYACLDKCRSPLSFITSRWQGRNESAQSLRIGVEHGLFCVGCCWSLMALMFLVGTGNLIWMLLLGAVMALEKNLPWGHRLSAPLGGFCSPLPWRSLLECDSSLGHSRGSL